MIKSIPFKRTNCDCQEDISACKKQPGYLIPKDIIAITYRLLTQGRIETPEQAIQFFRAGKGALVGNSITGHTWRIHTITPKMENGRCVFLDDKDRCTIHDVAPFGCAFFDYHMSKEEGQQRSAWGLRDVQNDKPYQALRQHLEQRDKSIIEP